MVSSNVPTGRHHGAPKHGDALLAGLLRCNRCGHKLTLKYTGAKHGIPRYSCSRAWIDTRAPHPHRLLRCSVSTTATAERCCSRRLGAGGYRHGDSPREEGRQAAAVRSARPASAATSKRRQGRTAALSRQEDPADPAN